MTTQEAQAALEAAVRTRVGCTCRGKLPDLEQALAALDAARKAEECKKCLGLGAVNSPVRGYEDYDSLTPCPECLGTGGRGKEG